MKGAFIMKIRDMFSKMMGRNRKSRVKSKIKSMGNGK
jgi:hypothetical protein